jgi:hypothetical protein
MDQRRNEKMAISMDPGIWVSALLTIFAYSIIFKDNPFYKLSEHILVGLSAGYLFITSLAFANDQSIQPFFTGKGLLVAGVSLVLGVLLFTKFFKRTVWLSNFAIAVLVGTATGVTLRGYITAQLMDQVKATIVPIASFQPYDLFNTLLSLLIIVSTLAYFLFSVEHKGAVGVMAKIGRYGMMAAFGAAYGGTVMTRLSMFIQRLQYLLFTWLGL